MSEQRNAPPESRQRRQSAGTDQGLRASILAGPEVNILEISRQELIIESDVRLTPGAGICLNVTLAGANYLAGGRITKVDAALASGQVKYRAGVKLDNEIPAFDQAAARAETPAPSPTPVPRAKAAAEKPPSAEPLAGAAEEPMDPQQTVQMLKTALRSSETVRKELIEQHEADRATWQAERAALEARIAKAEKAASSAGQQVNTSREAEKLLAGKHAQEQAAWAKERAALQETARQADARATQAEANAQQIDARAKQFEARAQQGEARVKELEPRLKQLEPRIKELEPKLKELEARAVQAEASARQSAARIKELEAAHASVQAALQKAEAHAQKVEAMSQKATADLATARENEQRLTRRIQEQGGKMDVLLKERQKLDAELEGALATVAAAEQKLASHDKEKRDWAAQKERLTARLQTTEKWCADQQELLYELQQHLGKAATLLDGWKPEQEDVKAGRKATA